MNPFIKKYHPTCGTHCWFCDREFNIDKQIFCNRGNPLLKTKDHIIPKGKIKVYHPHNFIASCGDCNFLKANRTAKQFAQFLQQLFIERQEGTHWMYSLFPLMIDRSWKLYNKTSHLHRTYKKLRKQK